MKSKLLLFLIAISLPFTALAQTFQLSDETEAYFKLIRPEFRGEVAYETVAFVEKYWRIAGNTGFNNSVFHIAERLESAGYLLEEKSEETDRFTYRIEKRPMSRPTWEPVYASIQLIGERDPLLSFETNRNMIYMYSSSTPKEGITAEVIYIANAEDLKTADVNGKIIFSDQMDYRDFRDEVNTGGALGVLIYDNPAYLQPEKNVTSIQFRSLPGNAKASAWALALSFEAKEKLKSALKGGPVTVKVEITTKSYESEELTIIANVKGAELPKESLVLSAHIQEPGANDNATGVGTQLEMAMLTAKLMQQQNLDIRRTLTFLWGDEIVSTRRYVNEKDAREASINWGISLDMVGENTDLTGGTFLIEKMPDPGAIWTRGDEKHTEWGGRPLRMQDLKPHYLNDFIINTFENRVNTLIGW
jgi:aminopeptidase YwaD